MENPRQDRDKDFSGNDSSSITTGDGEKTRPAPRLRSLDQFMAERAEGPKEDAWLISAYRAYWILLRKVYDASEVKPSGIGAHMNTAKAFIEQFYVCDGLNTSLNAAYQALLGPKPGDDLRLLIPDFVVDDHQWKHYQNGSMEWGLFAGHKWEEVHKIIVYGAKLILAVRATQIDQGTKVLNTVLDGFVQFDQNVGTPGNYVKKEVSLIKIQISRTKTEASGHGYPVPISDPDFPTVRGVLSAALLEPLSADNNSMRVKK